MSPLLAPLVLVLAALPAQDAPPPLTAVTWNLRFAADDGHPWSTERLPLTLELWRERIPDVVGTQEGLYHQVRDLEDALPEYGWIGLGREGGSEGELCAVFYRRERLEPLAFDHFWLSDTPETIGSRSFGNRVVRMATWVRFRDRRSDRELVVLNTHLDHQSAESRARSAELVAKRLEAFEDDLPLIVLGDFNAPAGESAPYTWLVEEARLADAWTAAPERGPGVGTFHGYRGPTEGAPRIDWVLFRGPLEPLEARVWTFARDGRFPSDHFPVAARFTLR